MARWVCASQQAILSRVREPSKTIAVRVQRFHCFDMFSVPEASGISVGFPEVLVWIALFSFSYVFNVSKVTNRIVPMALGLCISTSHTFSCSEAVKSALRLTRTWTALKYINTVSRAGGKRCTNVEARGSQVRGG